MRLQSRRFVISKNKSRTENIDNWNHIDSALVYIHELYFQPGTFGTMGPGDVGPVKKSQEKEGICSYCLKLGFSSIYFTSSCEKKYSAILLQRTWRKRTIKTFGMKKKLQKVPNMTIFTIQDNNLSKDTLSILSITSISIQPT